MSKWEDTVMSRREVGQVIDASPADKDEFWIPEDSFERVIKAQAEISFKAGQRSVVEWLERVRKIKVAKYQLKEWGI